MKTSILVLLSGVVCLSACHKKDEKKASLPVTCSEGSVRDFGIIGGEGLYKDNWLAKGIVFLVTKDGVCTGSLVDRNIVLTAAHCVENTSSASEVYVVYSNQPSCDVQNENLSGKVGRADRIEIHENYVRGGSVSTMKGDLALIRLKKPAPRDFKPLALPESFVAVDEGTRLIAAGYGKQSAYDSTEENDQFLNVVSLSPAKLSQLEFLARRSRFIQRTAADYTSVAENEYMYVDQTKGKGICSGDSGGPLLAKDLNGRYVVTGVASHVYYSPANPDHICGFVAAHTNIIYYKDWLESKFQLLRNWDSEKSTLF